MKTPKREKEEDKKMRESNNRHLPLFAVVHFSPVYKVLHDPTVISSKFEGWKL